MGNLKIKEITSFTDGNVNKTKLVISDNGVDKEIILSGEGELKAAVEV